jgi:glycosyltransferase involved in cell wall biosynthesis
MSNRSGRILLFIPCYRVEKQIPRVLLSLNDNTVKYFSGILFVDNRSDDLTADIIKQRIAQETGPCEWTLLLNTENYGFGGSVKVAFNYARENGYEYMALLHGDDQGNVNDLIPLIDQNLHLKYDCLLGSRFKDRKLLKGYSYFRTYGNMFFCFLFTLATFRKINDLGSGLDLYRVGAFSISEVKKFPDDLTFPYILLMFCITKNMKYYSFAIHWREDDQVSNVKLFRQSFKLISFYIHFLFFRGNCLKSIMKKTPALNYSSSLVASYKIQ